MRGQLGRREKRPRCGAGGTARGRRWVTTGSHVHKGKLSLGFLASSLEDLVSLCSLSVLGCQYSTLTAVPPVLTMAGLPCLVLGNQFVTPV